MFIPLDRQSSASLTRQLYEQLQLKIISGELPSCYRLPASRVLAKELQVSRNLVTEVYDTLKVEGYIESRSGSGTFVSSQTYLKSYKILTELNTPEKNQTSSENKSEEIRFETGIPDSLFPRTHWGRCLRDASINSHENILDYGNYNGIPQLQESLKQWLSIHKGIQCRSEQIFIFSGTHQGLDLLKELYSKNKDQMIIEDPNLPSIRSKKIKSISIDGAVPWLNDIEKSDNLKAIAVTPSHSYPLGRIMTIQKRIKLIEIAQKKDFRIIENDYDGELIYKGPVLSSMHLLAPGWVIHLGSFNGTMYPALRLAYMIVPEDLLERVGSLKNKMSFICPAIEQLALAEFIDRGYYDDHLIKLKKHFYKSYNLLADLLQKAFGNRVEIMGIGAGQYLTARFPGVDFIGELTVKMKKAGLFVQYAYDCAENPSEYSNILVFSFGKLNREQITRGIAILEQLF